MSEHLLIQTILLIVASTLGVGLLTLAGMPAAIGYILAGLALGPGGLALISAGEETRFLAELGLIFLMFMVGLDFSFATLVRARGDVLYAGSLQVVATTALVASVAWFLGLEWYTAVLIGGAVAMSSTAIAAKQLGDRGETASPHGRLALGILLFQDLATIPFLVMVESVLRQGWLDVVALMRQLVVAGIALTAAAVLSRPFVRWALAWAARSHSNELFLLVALLVALGVAYLMHVAGVSTSIGAFIAGMVIGRSDFRHRVEDDIRPFRDVLVGLFFVTIGMMLSPRLIAVFPLAVFGWTLVFLVGKAAVIFLVAVALRRPPDEALRAALILAHGGEFGLLIVTLAMTGLLPEEAGQPILIAAVLTMALAPVLIQHNGLVERVMAGPPHRLAAVETAVREAKVHLDDHVLLCGCGRVGRLVATALERAKLPYLAVEADLRRYREAQRLGYAVIHADAGRSHILEAVGLRRAKLVVLTFDNRRGVERILAVARGHSPSPLTIVSAADDRETAALVKCGASVVFPENLAAGLGLADQVLLLSGLDQKDAAAVVTALRAELNPELRDRVGI